MWIEARLYCFQFPKTLKQQQGGPKDNNRKGSFYSYEYLGQMRLPQICSHSPRSLSYQFLNSRTSHLDCRNKASQKRPQKRENQCVDQCWAVHLNCACLHQIRRNKRENPGKQLECKSHPNRPTHQSQNKSFDEELLAELWTAGTEGKFDGEFLAAAKSTDQDQYDQVRASRQHNQHDCNKQNRQVAAKLPGAEGLQS